MTLPAGVTLFGPDITPSAYWTTWGNTFPASNSFLPIGVFPFEEAPSALAAIGVNFGTPTRDDQAGINRPVQIGTGVGTMAAVIAQPGFYAGGQFWYRSQPSVSAAQTTVTGGSFSLPASTIPVASTAQWELAGAALSSVGGDALGQIVVQSSNGPQLVTFGYISGNTFMGCSGGAGTVSNGAAVGGAAWGSSAAFLNPGDELDGQGPTGFSDIPAAITANNATGSWGGLTTAAFLGVASSSSAIDSSRPLYLQVTGNIVDEFNNFHYTLAQKQSIVGAFNIASFDLYPLALRGQNVFANYDYLLEMRLYASSHSGTPLDMAGIAADRPCMTFIETGAFSGSLVTPTPAQTVALAWSSLVGGASGVQYFDGAGSPLITTPGAMSSAIAAFNRLAASLAPIIASPFAAGFAAVTTGTATVTVQGQSITSPVISTRYYAPGNMFYVLVTPHVLGASSAVITLTGIPAGRQITQVSVQTGNATTITVGTGGTVAVSFTDENQGTYLIIPNYAPPAAAVTTAALTLSPGGW